MVWMDNKGKLASKHCRWMWTKWIVDECEQSGWYGWIIRVNLLQNIVDECDNCYNECDNFYEFYYFAIWVQLTKGGMDG